MHRSLIKRRPLAETVLANLDSEKTDYRENDGNGLYFLVKANGSKYWQLRYKKTDGKWAWHSIGVYGNGINQLNGAEARSKAAQVREQLKNGIPLNTKANKKALEELQFQVLALEWYKGKLQTWTAKTASRMFAALENHVFPAFLKQEYAEISSMQWMEFFRVLEGKGIVEQARKIRSMCRDIYDLAKVTGRIKHNPIDGLHKFLSASQGENYSFVSIEELPGLLRAIKKYSTIDISIALQLIAMLACRSTELREAKWDEFNLEEGLWVIPKERMKQRREHVIPLPTQAIALLQTLHKYTGQYTYILPGRNDTTKPRSNTAFLMALRRLGYQGRQTSHGFRHLASTILNENNFNADHIEAQLSHVKLGVRAVYDKSIYIEQRREMMQWYADYLDKLY